MTLWKVVECDEKNINVITVYYVDSSITGTDCNRDINEDRLDLDETVEPI